MTKLCQFSVGIPYSGIKYLPNNEFRAVAVSENSGVCLLEVKRDRLVLIGNFLTLGVNLN